MCERTHEIHLVNEENACTADFISQTNLTDDLRVLVKCYSSFNCASMWVILGTV